MDFKFDGVFLNSEECDHIIKLSLSKDFSDAKTTTNIPNFRTNKVCILKKNEDIIVDRIYQSISDIVGLPIENIENIQVNRYNVGEYFRPHYDFLPIEMVKDNGGQRLYTFLCYLNDDFVGGQTNFPVLDKVIVPVKGNAVVWCNVIGVDVNYNTLHESHNIDSGEKFSIVTWVREYTYISNS